jgi:hypothetical protein
MVLEHLAAAASTIPLQQKQMQAVMGVTHLT